MRRYLIGFVIGVLCVVAFSIFATPGDFTLHGDVAHVASGVNYNEYSKSITVESPTAAEDLTFFFTNKTITVTEMRAVLTGSDTPSLTWTVRHHATDRTNAGNEVVTGGTATTSGTAGSDVTAFDDATIPADSFVWLETTADNGTLTEFALIVVYTRD